MTNHTASQLDVLLADPARAAEVPVMEYPRMRWIESSKSARACTTQRFVHIAARSTESHALSSRRLPQ